MLFFFRVRLFTCLATITRSFSVYPTRHRIFAYASKLICCFLFFFVSLPISSFHTKSHLFIYFKFFYSILHRSFLCYCCCCCFPHYFSRSHSLKLIFVWNVRICSDYWKSHTWWLLDKKGDILEKKIIGNGRLREREAKEWESTVKSIHGKYKPIHFYLPPVEIWKVTHAFSLRVFFYCFCSFFHFFLLFMWQLIHVRFDALSYIT